ncbi:hypothetical protein [Mesorhizobium sp. WSM3860]|uniref:hypothetical protein n=1 Tax=Mesorhizobium sp. WSM3860 TaxID=2029403 RepID=UPI001596E898|nr:hypothetical protein [Mesorhizobium sp. WSM3860]
MAVAHPVDGRATSPGALAGVLIIVTPAFHSSRILGVLVAAGAFWAAIDYKRDRDR